MDFRIITSMTGKGTSTDYSYKYKKGVKTSSKFLIYTNLWFVYVNRLQTILWLCSRIYHALSFLQRHKFKFAFMWKVSLVNKNTNLVWPDSRCGLGKKKTRSLLMNKGRPSLEVSFQFHCLPSYFIAKYRRPWSVNVILQALWLKFRLNVFNRTVVCSLHCNFIDTLCKNRSRTHLVV